MIHLIMEVISETYLMMKNLEQKQEKEVLFDLLYLSLARYSGYGSANKGRAMFSYSSLESMVGDEEYGQ